MTEISGFDSINVFPISIRDNRKSEMTRPNKQKCQMEYLIALTHILILLNFLVEQGFSKRPAIFKAFFNLFTAGSKFYK